MAASPKRVVWDACSWIALIQQEKSIIADGIDRYTRCRSVIDLAVGGKVEIVCSALCIAEVCKTPKIRDGDPVDLAKYFEQDYLLTVALGREIAEKARALMMSGLSGLKPPDACHLATALEVPQAVELHTYDEDLRALNGKLQKRDGTMLRIMYPDVGRPIPPLFKGAAGGN
jgi:predicted nucleic acid-binding protein